MQLWASAEELGKQVVAVLKKALKYPGIEFTNHYAIGLLLGYLLVFVGQPMPAGMQPVVQWMAPPATIPGVAPGLEYLTQVDQLLIHQQIEIMESESYQSISPN